ncbi:phage tail assembly chaperone [Burkholderia ubonensis]|uniref:Phage tail protein n=1 Tax=Burkholderia ubonensis TaxID=101571 RepID=A0A102MBQ9_9BURK|nr:phage tail assembly chaperone [Burkholderia ubonensis]KUZ66443.1 hypothetical protein WI35_21575 [Burkholderia ubonensis]KUZ94446.1 hypothetical protein WI38_07310 [Burkholderia ubonensis]KUZ96819.1 hypothetical protein WI39_10365 [Burkholderia ubonensis]KVA09059.1 hypothetical protein WI42_03810 [Burkholderia ubonensis]KVA31953.1 hypothetical protein WI43_30450 [Burkholderia ubonensis]
MIDFNGYCHDLMIATIKAHYPGMEHGRDFLVAHRIHPDTGKQDGDPFILAWHSDVDRPADDQIHALFQANEATYRAARIRECRDFALLDTDGKADVPSDAPESMKATCSQWAAYRQALRDITEQPNFPFDVAWPETPAPNDPPPRKRSDSPRA